MDAWHGFRVWLVAAFARLVGMPVETWIETEEIEEAEMIELHNPHMDAVTTTVIRNAMDGSLSAIWPVTHSSFAHALLSAQILITHQILILDGNIAGYAYELARAYDDMLDEGYDVDTIAGADIFDTAEFPETHFSIREELHAFIAEAIEGELEAAVKVILLFGRRWPADEANTRMVDILSHLLVSLAHTYTFNIIVAASD